MDFELTSHGYLRRPNLHDGHVLGLNLVDKGLRLSVSVADGRSYLLELVGLYRLRCNEFAEGYIIHLSWRMSAIGTHRPGVSPECPHRSETGHHQWAPGILAPRP